MAFTLEVLNMLKKDTEAFRLMEEMARELKNNYYSTQTTAFSLCAIAGYIGKNPGKGLSFGYTMDQDAKTVINASKSVYMLDIDDVKGINRNISIRNDDPGSKLFVNHTLKGQPLQGQETEKFENLRMGVIYKDDAGNALDVSKIRQGTDFIAEVTIEHPGILFPYTDLALNQVFPSGWEIMNTRVQEVNSGMKEDVFDYRDIRDDRVYTFFNLDQYQKKTFRVRLNAAYTGKYYLPAVNCEAMYETNVHANSKGRWVEVVR
jgi:hypothetical protein